MTYYKAIIQNINLNAFNIELNFDSYTFEQSFTPHRLLVIVVQFYVNDVIDQKLPKHLYFLNVRPPF